MWAITLGVSALLAAAISHLQYRQWSESASHDESPQLRSFQMNYFVVYLLANGADWLQGPYVYALYEQYGHDKDAIAILFICGFLSSMLFGTFVGSLADIYGRKRMALAFGAIYGFSCLTKLSPNFWILLFGRFTGGVATSLLFAVFESWMVYEHHRLGFDQNSLNTIFSRSVTLNGFVAILAGLAASVVAAFMGFVAPFMLSFVLLVVMTALVWNTWAENYGDADMEVMENLKRAAQAIRANYSILLLGTVQSFFEGAMYVFVFLWTPTLSAAAEEFRQPKTYLHGIVFSSFMLAVMLGSSLFGKLSTTWQPAQIMSTLLLVAAGALTIPIFVSNAAINLISFIAFEICCGIYFPTAASLRSLIIPENSRTTIMSMFRMGLNILVVVALKTTSSLSTSTVFTICVVWLLLATVSMRAFPAIASKETPEQLNA